MQGVCCEQVMQMAFGDGCTDRLWEIGEGWGSMGERGGGGGGGNTVGEMFAACFCVEECGGGGLW